jgi:hypothetical protein
VSHRFVFVAGLHRSGTSILYKTLGDHPSISGLKNSGAPEDEGQHVQTVFSPAYKYGGASRFGFHSEAHLTENSPLVTPQNRERLFEEWSRFWDLERPFLLEKSPPNLIRTRFLQAMFPDSYFVVIVRHPIAYAFPRGDANTPRTVHQLIRHWIACHEIFRADLPHLRNVIVMEYENFVQDPVAALNTVYSFLGIPYHPPQQEIKRDINRKYLDGWRRCSEGFPSNVLMAYVTRKYEERVRAFGYSLKDPDVVRGFGAA